MNPVYGRQKGKALHYALQILSQRIDGIVLEYEDLSDHDTSRNDIAWQPAVGMKVISKHKDIVINDLRALTKPNQKEWQAGPGNVHFNYKGYTAQGKQTAKAILEVLTKKR